MIPGLLNEQCFLHARIQELEEFWPFKALLTELMRRLSYCVTAELIPLMEVVGVMEVSVEARETRGLFKQLTKLQSLSSESRSVNMTKRTQLACFCLLAQMRPL